MFSLFHHFFLGLKLAFFRPVAADAWRATVGSLLMLMLASLGVTIFFDWLILDPKPGSFNPLAFRDAFWDLPILLLLGWLAAGRLAQHSRNSVNSSGMGNSGNSGAMNWPLLTPIALIAAWIVCQLLGYGLHTLLQYNYVGETAVQMSASLASAMVVWQLLIGMAVFRRVIRLSWFSSVVLTVPIAGMIFWSVAYPSTRFWYSDATEIGDQASQESVVSEEILELQSTLIYDQLNALEPHRPGVVDLYFIGFGGYATQDVFRKELAVIHPLMDQRFDTANRSIRLVNNSATLREFPLATVSNLRRTIAAIREKIDPAEDVVMLYLTSHGSKDHQLAVEYPPLELANLDPALLKSLFDEAGVRFKVIVVSACYSGGFLAPLKDKNSLIMTAADSFRTSFGCSDDSEFTYFGRAFFDEELRKTYSFEKAFTAALPIIREREKQYDPGAEFSNPQLSVGVDIAAKLNVLEARLGATGKRAEAP